MSSKILESYDHWLEQEKMPAGKKKSMKAAIQLFAQKGFNGTSTVDIAEMAGVSQATIFKYFKTKEELLIEIILPVIPQLFHEFYPALSKYSKLEEIVAFFVQDRFSFILANKVILKIIFQEALINDQLRQNIMNRMMSPDLGNQILEFLDHLKKENPQVNQELTTVEILRIFAGPFLAYYVQRFILEQETVNEEQDLRFIQNHIINGLLLK